MYYKKQRGNSGEEIASAYLENLGYKILVRNFQCRQGEIDIIALDNDEFVFVEVKTRTNKMYGEAVEAVNNIKKLHIWKTAEYYIYLKHLEDKTIRFDVIEVYLYNNEIKINHIKQALEM